MFFNSETQSIFLFRESPFLSSICEDVHRVQSHYILTMRMNVSFPFVGCWYMMTAVPWHQHLTLNLSNTTVNRFEKASNFQSEHGDQSTTPMKAENL